jgi:sulfide:quinone oxidoreductase
MTEGLAIERCINEGGRLAPEAVIERELRPADYRRRSRSRPRVLIAGGGVAGLETLLGLRTLAGDRVDITLVTPELRFVNRSMAVDQPFRPQRPRGMRMQDVTAEHGARWHRGALDRVEHQRRVAVTKDGDELPYDRLVLALGARPNREWHADWVLTFHDGRDGPTYRLLLHQLREGRNKKVAFVKPAGATWPMPLYDLAFDDRGATAPRITVPAS